MKKIDFTADWTFTKAGDAPSKVTLPHDAQLHNGREAGAASGSGSAYFLGGNYTYEKRFSITEEEQGEALSIVFEGIYPQAKIYLNDQLLGNVTNGYLKHQFLLEPLRNAQENCIRVEVDGSQLPDSRWYAGAGIYRPVWLQIGAEIDVKIKTLSIDPAVIEVSPALPFEIYQDGKKLLDGQGQIEIPNAKLWSAESPDLYSCKIAGQEISFGIRKISWSLAGFQINGCQTNLKGGCLHHDNGILGACEYDEAAFRKVSILKKFGFNAIRSSHNPISEAMLRACDKLGMYVIDEGWDMWYKPKNKYDYARYFEQNMAEDIKKIVQQDFNHPSVIMYSIGNENTEPAEERGVALGKQLVDLFHQADSTRPVTAGINITLLLLAKMGIDFTQAPSESQDSPVQDVSSSDFNEMAQKSGKQMMRAAVSEEADTLSTPILDSLDIAGYNYGSTRYEMEATKHPERIILGTETYTYDIASNWQLVEKLPYLIGDFMWTAWDHLGEVGIGAWSYEEDSMSFTKPYPWLLSNAGAIDILGHDTAAAGYAATVWGAQKQPYIGVTPANHQGKALSKAIWRGTNALPYWSYQDCQGAPTQVEVYSAGSQVELLINNQSQGVQATKDGKAVFEVAYQAGEVKALAYDQNQQLIGEQTLFSATGKKKLTIRPVEKLTQDALYFFEIDILGENGEIECNLDTKVAVEVHGGEFLAFGSANPRTAESFLEQSYTTYYGRSLLAVKMTEPEIEIGVAAPGFDSVEATFQQSH